MTLKAIKTPVLYIALSTLVLIGASEGLEKYEAANEQAAQKKIFEALLPGSSSFTAEMTEGADEAIHSVHKGDTGYVIKTVTSGYAGDVVMMVGVDNGGIVTGLKVQELNETQGLGSKAATDLSFAQQFVGTSGGAEIGAEIDSISGATVTSKAVARGVNAAVAYVTGADIASAATTWGG